MSNTKTTKAPEVSAGTKVKTLRVLNADGSELVSLSWDRLREDTVIHLEGQAELLDLDARANVRAALRIEDTPTAHPKVLFQGQDPWSRKKGGILVCDEKGCSEVFPRWTSDMHQATKCDRCRVKARRARAKAKRAAAKSAKSE